MNAATNAQRPCLVGFDFTDCGLSVPNQRGGCGSAHPFPYGRNFHGHHWSETAADFRAHRVSRNRAAGICSASCVGCLAALASLTLRKRPGQNRSPESART